MIKSGAVKILNSFNLKVSAKQLIVIDHMDDIKKLNIQDCKNFFIIGEATNLIMNYKLLVLGMRTRMYVEGKPTIRY